MNLPQLLGTPEPQQAQALAGRYVEGLQLATGLRREIDGGDCVASIEVEVLDAWTLVKDHR